MVRALAVALLLLAPVAYADATKKKKGRKSAPTAAQIVHPFADVPVAKLHVNDTRGNQAIIENKSGEIVLVRAGDLLGAEGVQVVKVTLGCVQLKGPEASFTLCADVPDVPRT